MSKLLIVLEKSVSAFETELRKTESKRGKRATHFLLEKCASRAGWLGGKERQTCPVNYGSHKSWPYRVI